MALPAGPASRSLASASTALPPRLMIVTDHSELARALEHHISIVWPDAECRVHAPRVSGRFHAAFRAVGYDAVVLDHRSEDGRGEEWLNNFLHRSGFPPIVYLAPGDDPALAARVVEQGAVECVIRERIDHRRFANALRDAVLRRRQELALLRTGAQAEQLSRFGPVTILGHRFVRELATGGTSMVYLAESERAGDMVVLKVLRDAPETGDEHMQFSRFLQEYELISKIRHPNVVRIFDLGIADDHAYIAMEYFPRGDLRARISNGIEARQAVEYLAQMAGALQVVHEVGVLHRDLKPGNIMERADGSLALIDFGLAKPADGKLDMTAAGEIFGTPYYMSPEQGHGHPLDERSDLYSLGVIFYEMLTRKKPYLAPTPMGVIYLHGNAPIPEFDAELHRYQPLLNQLLAKEPSQRIASARDLLQQLSQFEEET